MKPFLTALFSILLFTVPAKAIEYCYSADTDKLLLYKAVGQWKIMKTRCSCFAIKPGKPNSLLAINYSKTSTVQTTPDINYLVTVDEKIKGKSNKFSVIIDGFEIEANVEHNDRYIIFEPKADLLGTIGASSMLKVGPYQFLLIKSAPAIGEMKNCFKSLKGK